MIYQKQQFCHLSSAMCRLVAFILLFVVIGAGSAWAQTEVTIGTGTQESTIVPFYPYYCHTITASIYTAAEVGQAGTITQIAYDCSTASVQSLSELKVYMATTSSTTFASTSAWPASYTQVYASSLTVAVGGETGWYTIALDTPFQYDPSDGNLVIIVTKKASNWNSGQKWRYSAVTDATLYRGSDSDDTYGDITNTTAGTKSAQRPNVKLTFGASQTQCETQGASQTATSTSQSAGYVITYQNAHFVGGTSTADLTSFNPNTCIWTNYTGSKWSNNGGGYLRDNATFITNASGSATNVTINGTDYTATGAQIKLGTRFVRWNGSGWERTSTQNNRNILFSVTKYTYTEAYRNPVFAVSSNITALGSSAATCSITTQASYTPGYFDYVFYNGAHHYFKSDNTTSIAAAPSAESVTYTWGLEGIAAQYATINSSTGVISYISYPDADIVARVTLTAQSASRTVAVCQNVTFKASPAPTAISVSANTTTCYVGETATLTYQLTPANANNDVVAVVADPNKYTASVTPGANGTGTVTITGLSATSSPVTLTLNARNRAGSTAQTATVAVTVRDRCATPSISFNNSTNTVTITTATPGAAIHYTTNGSTPTASSATYSAAFSVTTPTTVQAIAAKASYDNSAVGTLSITKVATPAISQNGNSLQIACATAGAAIHYTTDGSAPTASSPVYTSALTGVASGTTVKAIAIKSQCITSDAASLLYREQVPAPAITFAPNDPNTTAQASIDCSLAGVAIYYTTNGTDPTTASTLYTAPFSVSDGATVKAIAAKANYNNSPVTSETYVACRLATPVISITSGGVSFSSTDDGVTFRYTTNGSNPTASSTAWDGSPVTTIANGATIKVMATRSDCGNSAVATATHIASGVGGTTVTINDLEDHRWTYYKPNGTKPDADYPDVLTSPHPRNVKITYQGGSVSGASAVAVSATESANTFVYYKTLEKLAWGNSEGRWLTGDYAYQVIPNPFSKRPKSGSTYYGFAGWKIVSGGEYISGKSNNDILALEEKINFVNLPYTDTNCISAEIVLQATWTAATTTASATAPTFTGGTYETNFWVVTGSSSLTISAPSSPMTVMGCYPDGSAAGTATIASATSSATAANVLKIENIKIGNGVTPVHPLTPQTASSVSAGTGTYTVQAAPLIVGRGCTGTVNKVQSGGTSSQYTLRIESGKYIFVNPMSSGSNSDNSYGRIVFGCDYDRVADDGYSGNGTGDNTKLRVVSYVSYNGSGAGKADNNTTEWMDITIKSGYYGYSANYSLYTAGKSTEQDGIGLCYGGNGDGVAALTTIDADGNSCTYSSLTDNNSDNTYQRLMSFYCGRTRGGGKGGVVRVLVEGGELSSINLGGAQVAQDFVKHYFRMRGGWVKGAIYGTASITNSQGSNKLVITGGEVNGWVAGGCNGTDFGSGDGYNQGTCYIYAGGTAELRSHFKDGVYNNAWGKVGGVDGGNIFGSGRGLPPPSGQSKVYTGSTTTSYVVVSDECYVEQNVYGGGYNGVSKDAKVYILGGTVGKNVFGGTARAVSENATWRANNADVRMYDGTVLGNVYGGHDETGTMFQNVNVTVTGGTVGARSSDKGNVFGGGYGSATIVQGNVIVQIGNAARAAENPEIFGSVYGGGDAAPYTATDKTFTVTMSNGHVHQHVFGGGKGATATVTGNTSVTIEGKARIDKNVFGGGNAAEVTGNTFVKIQ